MGWIERRRRVALAGTPLVLLGVAQLQLGALPVAAGGPTVTGAGSTWVQIALDQWRADIARQGYSINYQGVGSSAGRQFFIINQVDFAASEIPFQPDEVSQLQGEHKSYQYLPDVAGGTSLMYNLHTPSGSRITSLRLDAQTAAGIFTGGISSWQDSSIRSLNPGLEISETTVVPVIRSDGSGTSAQFSLYLADQAAGTWSAFVSRYGCPAPCSLWPPFPGSTQQKGSDGVANFISNNTTGSGAIGYVEAGYAFGRSFPVASLRNASGAFVQPTSMNVSTALTHAQLHADLTQDLSGVYRAPEASAYPMSSYSYMITQTSGFDSAKGKVLGTWLIYIACGGQRQAAPLGYSPLPPNLVQAVFNAVQRIPGAPAPPPIDAQHCPNPTVTGEGPGGGPGGGGGPGSGGARGVADGRGGAAAAKAGQLTAAQAAAAAAQATAAAQAASQQAAAAGQDLTGDPTADMVLDGPAGRVATLGEAQRHALFERALRIAGLGWGQPAAPLMLAAAVVLLVVFGPTMWDWRRFAISALRRTPRSARGPS